MRFDDLGLLLGVIEIQMILHMLVHDVRFDILWHVHFYASLLRHSLHMLTWNVKLLLCSLDLIACMIIALSCILLLVRLDLFVACGVHRSNYACFLRGLICSPLIECTDQIIVASYAAWFVRRFVSHCLGHDPCLFRHGVRLRCRCDFQLAGFYPCFEMSCFCGPNFSCCGWRVGFACDHWWLFLLLWLLCLGHMHFDLLCCLSGLCLSWGLSKLIW
jgi:hypothetical protein